MKFLRFFACLICIFCGISIYYYVALNTWVINNEKEFTYDIYLPEKYQKISQLPRSTNEELTTEEYKYIENEGTNFLQTKIEKNGEADTKISIKLQTTITDKIPNRARTFLCKQEIHSPIDHTSWGYEIYDYTLNEKEKTITIKTIFDYNNLFNIAYFILIAFITGILTNQIHTYFTPKKN